MIRWHIGCSGFHYREWKGVFYPDKLPQRLWFDHYARQFNTLELNVTFYKFPTLKSLQNWHDQAPPGFSFSAKMPRSITHYKRFNQSESLVNDFYAVLREGLGDKLGCVLTQLPPQFAYSEENLSRVVNQLDPGFQNVIEFRNESWWREDVIQQLRDAGISFCGVSFPGISRDEAIINLPLCYYRFHGVPVLFHSEYPETFIERIYHQVQHDPKTKTAFIYFNNTASMAALRNARYFRQLTESGSVEMWKR